MTSTPEILVFFAKLIERELGIIYSEANYFQLQNRLEQIAKTQLGCSVEDLYSQAKTGLSKELKTHLLDLATNNETSFFRDARIFKSIESLVLNPRLAAGRASLPLNIWSAASSSGQEALSIAMMIHEWNEKSPQKTPFKIVGTDISSRILERARGARYSDLEVNRGLVENLKLKYFTADPEGGWRAKPILRDQIDYRSLNLKEIFHFAHSFDIVFCRNVLIYQAVEAKREILKRVTETLSVGGVLVLGAGESVYGLSDQYDQIESDGSIIYRKRESVANAA